MVKIYWDTVNNCPEIVCPDGSSYWFWHDSVSNQCGWYKSDSNTITIKDDPERFKYIGEL